MSDTGHSMTLEEIGRLAGVSRSTVSRVLNDHPHVRPEVRALVHATIEQTGYLPNHAARALASKQTGLIGLVMPTDVDELFGDPYYSTLVHGIQEGCAEMGSAFSIFPVYDKGGESTVLSALVAQGFVDGIIVTAGPRSDDLIKSLSHRGRPLVVVGHPRTQGDIRRVDVENRAGSRAAVEHLHRLGRRRIGFIGTTPDYLFGAERLEGYCDALAATDTPYDDRLVRLTEPTPSEAYDATLSVLPENPDALHVATDPMARGALRALRDAGRRVPDDIALVGFDGLPNAVPTDPPMTTVVQPVAEVGRTAVRLLLGDDSELGTVILRTSLRIGESCGATSASPRDGQSAE